MFQMRKCRKFTGEYEDLTTKRPPLALGQALLGTFLSPGPGYP